MKKDDVNIFWKIMYYLWVLKIRSKKSDIFEKVTVDDTKIRVLHPLGFIIFIILFLWFGLTEGFFNKEMKEIKKIFCLI